MAGEVNHYQLQRWIGAIIRGTGTDLFRYKGVLAGKGMEDKYVFQGVHMMFSGAFVDMKWKEEETRECRFVFSGENLDKLALVDGFMKCNVEGELRFKAGDHGLASVQGWKDGRIIALWDEGNPYVIDRQVQSTGGGGPPAHRHNPWDRIHLEATSGMTETERCSRRAEGGRQGTDTTPGTGHTSGVDGCWVLGDRRTGVM